MKKQILSTALLLIGLFIAGTIARADQLPVVEGQILHLHTASLGETGIVGYTSDGRFVGIACNRDVFKSSADLIFESQTNSEIDIVDYKPVAPYRGPGNRTSPNMPLETSAMKIICNQPNGFYTLKIVKSGDQLKASLLSTDSLEANSNKGYRGY